MLDFRLSTNQWQPPQWPLWVFFLLLMVASVIAVKQQIFG